MEVQDGILQWGRDTACGPSLIGMGSRLRTCLVPTLTVSSLMMGTTISCSISPSPVRCTADPQSMFGNLRRDMCLYYSSCNKTRPLLDSICLLNRLLGLEKSPPWPSILAAFPGCVVPDPSFIFLPGFSPGSKALSSFFTSFPATPLDGLSLLKSEMKVIKKA